MSDSYTVVPIGVVRSARTGADDDGWDAIETSIELDPASVEPSAVAGLDTFSHIEVVYLFHLVDPDAVCRGARHPRGRADWPLTGILAQRAKDRPNRLGVTICRLDGVDGGRLRVTGLDAIDGTPVLDVKPYMDEFGARGAVVEPDWARQLMAGYWD
jgi:tRNA (adenine37-N6)-methyltransferase